MKLFLYGDRVRVKLPKRRALFGRVYSQYVQPGSMRRICVELDSGVGIAYPVCYVTRAVDLAPRPR